MCGRFSLTKEEQVVNQRFRLAGGSATYIPRFNGAPGQHLAVISNHNPDNLSFFKWGLVPFWAEDAAIGNKLINARSETVHEKPSYKKAFKSRRCLVLSDGFFEWKKDGSDKIPHYIFLPHHQLFAMAGLWETWEGASGEPLHTFTILTTTPNTMMKDIHHRMPVILPGEEEENWLKNDQTDELRKLLKPYEGKMEHYPVSKLANSPRNDTKEVVEPAPEAPPTLF